LKRIFIILFLGGILLSLFGFQAHTLTATTTLELTVRQVVVTDDVASITGPSVNAKVELFDNLGEELISSGATDSDGRIEFILDKKYPLSGKGLFYTTVLVDGVNNGVFTCEQGITCTKAVFSVEGLNPDLNDAILVVNVVRSDNLSEPVEGIPVNVWPVDAKGIPLVIAPT